MVFNNFFTAHYLFTELKLRGIGTYSTVKTDSGVLKAHLAFRSLTSKVKDYSEQVNTIYGKVNVTTGPAARPRKRSRLTRDREKPRHELLRST
jgi:hypothetical protein